MNRASAGQSVKVAALAAGPVAVLRGLGFNERLYLADKLSNLLRVKVSRTGRGEAATRGTDSQSAGVDPRHDEIRRSLEGAESGV